MNKIYETGKFPVAWKTNLLGSYRGTALLSATKMYTGVPEKDRIIGLKTEE
jgi:hypothetical protein